MRCKHPTYARRYFLRAEDRQRDPLKGTCNLCCDCGTWLSLGPANDEPEAVRVEIRAAELAANWTPSAWEVDGGSWRERVHLTEPWRYLAACIATHEEP